MGFAPTWLRQVSPLFHKTTLTTVSADTWRIYCVSDYNVASASHCFAAVGQAGGWVLSPFPSSPAKFKQYYRVPQFSCGFSTGVIVALTGECLFRCERLHAMSSGVYRTRSCGGGIMSLFCWTFCCRVVLLLWTRHSSERDGVHAA